MRKSVQKFDPERIAIAFQIPPWVAGFTPRPSWLGRTIWYLKHPRVMRRWLLTNDY
jgi:hypothetical protein